MNKTHKRVIFYKVKRLTFLSVIALLLPISVYYAIKRDKYDVGPLHKDNLILYSQKCGFFVKSIKVLGAHNTGPNEIIAASKIHKGLPLLSLDLNAVTHSISRLPWIHNVKIKRHISSGSILIEVQEHKPFCVVYEDNQHWLIAHSGQKIQEVNGKNYAHLPRTKGANAPQHLQDLYEQIQKHQAFLMPLIESSEYINNRRWSLFLTNKNVILLPEKNVPQALKRLSALLEQRPNSLDTTKSIDLRIPGRVIIQKKPCQKKSSTLST